MLTEQQIQEYLTHKITWDEQLHLKGIIYLIFNTYDKKAYVGKTINNFNKRYSGGKWWINNKNRPSNRLLDKVVSKYGYKQFRIFILESNIDNIENLDLREKYWAKHLNTYAPNGYNIRECGEGGEFYGPMGEESKRIGRAKRIKKYTIKNIRTQELIQIDDLEKWSKENNIKCNALRNLLCGIVEISQGYCLPDFNEESIYFRDKIMYVRNLSTNEIIEINDVESFCKEQNLHLRSFKNMLMGYTSCNKGFCLASTKPEHILLKGNKTPSLILINPNGEYIKAENPPSFCKEHDLPTNKIYMVQRGVLENYKGWKVYNENSSGTLCPTLLK